MMTLLITVALLNIGLLVMLLVRYQPQNGVPTQKPAETPKEASLAAHPYAAVYGAVPQVPPPVPVAKAPVVSAAPAPPVQELQPLYDEAARQLDRRLDRLEKLIREAEGVSRHLEQRVTEVRRATEAQGFTPGLPTRHAKVRFLNNEAVRRILDLSQSGMSPVQIARELGRGVDEVHMTLNLREMTG